jgi:hypothetical protein
MIDDEGNIHRAAEILNMSQPAASKLLKDLEDVLGISLFERQPRGMSRWCGSARSQVIAAIVRKGHLLEPVTLGKGLHEAHCRGCHCRVARDRACHVVRVG